MPRSACVHTHTMPLLQAKPSGGDSPSSSYNPRHVSSHHNTGWAVEGGQRGKDEKGASLKLFPPTLPMPQPLLTNLQESAGHV